MRRFRQGSVTQRVAIGVVAAYALLLQVFLAAAAPAIAGPDGSVLCASAVDAHGSTGGSPAGHPHDCPCCILCCAAAFCAYTAAGSAAIAFPARAASAIEFPPAPVEPARSCVKYFFAARGPPQRV